jgi:Transposase DNA-binding/Transposase DDE domain
MELTNPEGWAKDCFGAAQLGDLRRTNRLVTLAGTLAQHTGASIPSANGNNAAGAEGAYRFARNDAVEPGDIARAGFEATVKLLKKLEPKVVLAPEDSTVLSYAHDVDDLGDIGGPASSKAQGILVHSTILVDPETERTLGLVAQDRWIRAPEDYGKKHERQSKPYEEKESFKWQRNAEEMRKALGAELMTRVISVCDREADVFAYLANKQANNERFIVRAESNRNVIEQDDEDHLVEVLNAAAVRGTAKVELAQRGGRAARTATLRLRSTAVELKRPKSLSAKHPARIQANAVLAEEVNPADKEERLSWMLLTTEPIHTLDDVERVLKFYRMRWRVEVFHKAWKTGAGVERQRMQTAENLERIAVVLAFVAIRLLQLRELFDEGSEVACDQILDKETWTLLWVSVETTKPPRTPPSAAWAYAALARLAGWTDTKRTGKVGWETLWKGWSRLQERYEGLQAYKRLQSFK